MRGRVLLRTAHGRSDNSVGASEAEGFGVNSETQSKLIGIYLHDRLSQISVLHYIDLQRDETRVSRQLFRIESLSSGSSQKVRSGEAWTPGQRAAITGESLRMHGLCWPLSSPGLAICMAYCSRVQCPAPPRPLPSAPTGGRPIISPFSSQ